MIIVTGRIGSEGVIVDNSYSLGDKQMLEHEASWPDGFNSTISSSVITLKESKKHDNMVLKTCLIQILYIRE